MLGGCLTTGFDPEYYCKDCENKWSKADVLDNLYGELLGIRANVGGYPRGQYEIEVDFESRNLKWRHFGAGEEESIEKIVDQKEFIDFYNKLMFLDLFSWKEKYIDEYILDGTQWSLEFIRGKKNKKKYGDNKFPDNWEDFCRLMSKVSGKTFE
ncbi:MAG: hypothetical protein GX219_07480 [Tissierellia bacterium]|nr:hypothetical protein [Tissierellia bacterium]